MTIDDSVNAPPLIWVSLVSPLLKLSKRAVEIISSKIRTGLNYSSMLKTISS